MYNLAHFFSCFTVCITLQRSFTVCVVHNILKGLFPFQCVCFFCTHSAVYQSQSPAVVYETVSDVVTTTGPDTSENVAYGVSQSPSTTHNPAYGHVIPSNKRTFLWRVNMTILYGESVS